MKSEFYSEKLDGKKVIFIGNSMIYYGQCVERNTELEQEYRENDKGYFYQLCKSNGVEVSVTNWTFGGHQLADFYADVCPYCLKKGRGEHFHMPYLKNRFYDYVIFSEGSHDRTDFVEMTDRIMETFRTVNPDVRFVYLCHLRTHMLNRENVLHNLKIIADKGVVICDWGKVLYDILNGKPVPGGSFTYNNNSFIISQSEKDGHHGNLLSGYITALATYCTITGKPAEGQNYGFYNDSSENTTADVEAFKEKYYCFGDTETNFDKIFESPDEMQGIQRLIDENINEEEWKTYGI